MKDKTHEKMKPKRKDQKKRSEVKGELHHG